MIADPANGNEDLSGPPGLAGSAPAATEPSQPVVAGLKFPAWLLAVVLGVITLALYWPATRCDFNIFDDGNYVAGNPRVLAGLSLGNAGWALTTFDAGNWHPLTWLSLMLDVNLFGRQAFGFHFTNVVLHAANVVLLFWLLRLLTGATWRSALVAALFGWHPAHVESVAWISERKDVLSTFFGFLSLIFYTRYARSQAARPLRNSAFFLSLCCFALGLMSKPMLVTWPFVMLLLDYWPLNRLSPFQPSAFSPQPFLEKIPFFALAAAAAVVTFLAQRQGGYVTALGMFSPAMRIENALVSYGRYLGKLFWPADLAIFYPYPASWPVAAVLGAVLLLLAGSAGALWQRRRPFLLMGWLWFLGTLLPVIGLVQVGGQSMADRYTYIPSIGIFILTVWGAEELARRSRAWARASAFAGTVAVFLCLAGARQQLDCWRTNEALFRHSVAVTTDNYIALNALGVALNQAGRTDEAINALQEAVRLNPNFAEAHVGLGSEYLKKDWVARSMAEFREALRVKPEDAEARNDLGVALTREDLGDLAIVEYRKAIRAAPNFALAHVNLGSALARAGRLDESISEFREALRLNPGFTEAQKNLKLALALKAKSAAPVSGATNR